MGNLAARTTRVSLIALGLVGSMVLSAFPPVAAAPTPTAVGTIDIGGITWTEDIRVTRNGGADTRPQITVDAQHDAHIMWQSTRAPSGYYYVKLNRLGEFLSQETFIPGRVLAGWGDAYPLGPTIDIDSQNNLHIVYDDGWQNVKYMKFDEQGNVLVPEKNVGPNDGSASHTPSIAVGTDDTVHISHEEYKFQCEDIAYDKLANDGSDIWIDRVVSSDVASHCEFDLIKVDRFSGSVMFTFGSGSGTWLARFNKFGVKDMPSVKLRAPTDYLIADVAATPDGNMHVVWEDGGKIVYSLVNVSGAKVLDAVPITNGATTPGFPRIAATSDNRAVVVWEDSRAGNKEIFFAILDSTLVQGNVLVQMPENIRLTTAGGDSTAPWIAIDPDDNFHVAWVDTRDSNQEIYYKFAFNFALELYADPIDIANMLFMHPNETKILPMLLKNKGGLADGYTLDLAYTSGADALGWRVFLDTTFIESLDSDQVTPVLLSVHAPGNAKDKDNISVTVNASSISAPSEFDQIQLQVFVTVSREVKLSVANKLQIGANGGTVAFNMIVSNTGDVREDDIELRHILGTGPVDWTVWLDKARVALDPKESTNFTVYITIPENAPGLALQTFGITAYSEVDQTASDSISLQVSTKQAFVIQMTADPTLRYVNPGEVATFQVSVHNIGNLAGQVQINVEAQDPAIKGFLAALDSETVYLRGGEQTGVRLSVTVPANAIADTRLTLVVQGIAPKFGQEGRVEVTTFVNRVQGLHFDMSSALPGRVGRPVSFDLEITNNGNGDEILKLNPSFTPAGWTMEFLDGPASISNVFIAHGQVKTVQVRVTIGTDALAGVHQLSLGALDAFGHAHIVPVAVSVVQFFAVDLTTPEFRLDGSPGGILEYDVVVSNNGNGPDNFTLSVDGLGAGFGQPRFFKVFLDDVGNEIRAPIEGVLAIGAHQTVQTKLIVNVPIDAKESSVQFSARASSQGQEEDAALLQIDIKKADLKPGVITLTPATPEVGQITAITLEVQNTGDIDAKPVIVDFYDNGQKIGSEELFRVAAHSKAYVTFAWLPEGKDHVLRFVIDPTSGPGDLIGLIVESNEDNNIVESSREVGTTRGLPGFEAPFAAVALAVAFLAVRAGRRASK